MNCVCVRSEWIRMEGIHIIRMGLQYLSIVMQVTSNLHLYSNRYILSYSVDCHVVISLAITNPPGAAGAVAVFLDLDNDDDDLVAG